MSISLAIGISITTFTIGYVIGKFRGVDAYHEYLLRKGKIHEK